MDIWAFVPVFTMSDFRPRGAGSSSSGEVLTYGARIAFSAESTTSSTRVWTKESSTSKSAPTQLQTTEAVKISLAGYLCRLQSGHIFCYSPVARRCVILRDDRSDKPDEVLARRGGQATGVCQGFEMYEEL